MNILAFVIVLGVLIFVHELGHFLMAKILGVGVTRFSLGFGPKIVGKKIGMTDYMISAIPLGGYVKMIGEDPSSVLEESEISLSFSHKSLLRRSLIVLAGPAFNFLLALVIFFGYFQISGLPLMKPEVGTVQKGMPAYEAGILAGDTIVAINGKPLKQWDEMAALINQSGGRPVKIKCLRNRSIMYFTVTPKLVSSRNLFGEKTSRYIIGITASGAVTVEKVNPFEATAQSILRTWQISKLTVLSIGKIIAGTLSPKTIGGPIMIAQMAGQQAKAGIVSLLFFIALLSINLGILNLLPIPVLDGGHLFFFLIEAISRRPLNLKVREVAQQVGMSILILLMIYVFYNDIARILFHQK
ncbi:MAG: RIP metalloprotease RseP [Deltaproteobacteria bacterium]|nr:MAG: RIP metalloprotease RseP [Deltaproteobacteria bacterium]